MTEMEAGWYRDPAPADPAAPTTVRFWDGRQWTTQVRQASRQQRSEWRVEEMARQREYAASVAPAGGGYAGGYGAVGLPAERDVMPDGAVLARWWSRVWASLLDGVIVIGVTLVLGWSFASDIGRAYSSYVEQAMQAGRAGAPAPDPTVLTGSLAGPMAGLAVVALLVNLVYGVGFLKALQATPGKLLLGLEVRLREHPGRLSWGTVLVRWLAQFGVGLLRVVPVLGLLGSLYSIVDGLWPLWDGRRQALHDKVARTQVVRRR